MLGRFLETVAFLGVCFYAALCIYLFIRYAEAARKTCIHVLGYIKSNSEMQHYITLHYINFL